MRIRLRRHPRRQAQATQEPRPQPTPAAAQQPMRSAAPTRPQQPQRASRITWPLVIALLSIAAVWIGGAVWSFGEQTDYAHAKGFEVPQLLPLVLDGLAFAMASVAWAAVLDGRSAGFARIGTVLAIAGSASSNGAWAWERSGHDVGTVALAVAVPIAANVAFEVLLGEIRRTVQRSRGLPAPVPVPAPRVVRLVLSPFATFASWRRLVLAATDPRIAFAAITGDAQRDAELADAAMRIAPQDATDPPAEDPWDYASPVIEAERIAASAAPGAAHHPAALTAAAPDAQRSAALPAAPARPQRIALKAGELTDDQIITAIRTRVVEAHHRGASPSQRELQQLVDELHPGAPRPGPRRLQRLVEQILAGLAPAHRTA
jgi:hypothetical protein